MSELERIKIGKLALSDTKNEYEQIEINNLFDLDFYNATDSEIESLKKGQVINANKKLKDNKYLLINKTKDQNLILGILELKNNNLKVVKLFGNRLEE
ncbi:hypothetical protein [Mycoplasmopsis fermentans]|nr:hypothetical protein [Mycoplasmopsis fermentans]RMX35875.1 tRNA pseudouridine synthase B domain protein [Mycoplasmopsis fermentans MF-I1]